MRLRFLGMALVVLTTALSARAVSFRLDEDGAVVTWSSGVPGQDFRVGGKSHQWAQNFFLSVGGAAEKSLDALATGIVTNYTTGPPYSDPTATATWTTDDWTARVDFRLDGIPGGLPKARLYEDIAISNTSGDDLELSLYQYVNFFLGATTGDQYVEIVDGEHAVQKDKYPAVTYWMGESVTGPAPDQWAVEDKNYPQTLRDGLKRSLLYWLNEGSKTDFGQVSGPLTGSGQNYEYVFQWDFTLGEGETFEIQKVKTVSLVPEPLTVLGVFLGVAGLGAYIRKRRIG